MLLENNPYPEDVRVRSEASSLTRAGYDVEVICPRGAGQAGRADIDGVRVRRLRIIDGSSHGVRGFVTEYLSAAVLLNLAAVRALAGGSRVLHLHNPPDIFFPAGALFRIAGRKVVFDHHDLFPETLAVKFGSRAAISIANVCQRLTFAVASHVIATNQSYAEVALASGKAADRVTIVRNGPPIGWTLQDNGEPRASSSPVQLLYLGAISVQDGVAGLAPILADLRAGPWPVDLRLTVVGDGDGREEFERALAGHGIADRVTFTGWVSAEHVPELLAQADVCLDPAPPSDVNQRSTMTKIAEYLALGKPVVAYDLLETRRTAGDAAILVEPGNEKAFGEAIRSLAHDPELRLRLRDKARRRAASLTWERSEQALLAAYAALGSCTAINRRCR